VLSLAVCNIVQFEALSLPEAVISMYQKARRHNLQDTERACSWQQYATANHLCPPTKLQGINSEDHVQLEGNCKFYQDD
jgi:hypothetical protein